MKTSTRIITVSFIGVIILFLIIHACSSHLIRSDYTDINTLLHDAEQQHNKPFLKAHLKNGDVYILRNEWRYLKGSNTIWGRGTCYDFNRNKKFEGQLMLPVDSVAIFETNVELKKRESARIAALSILAAENLILSAICLSFPKACFGSCPTFYINPSNNVHFSDAEGFSNAISPSLEYADIDALNYTLPIPDTFSITMKNEALETHCVNDIKLLACPVKPGERVYNSTGGEYYKCGGNYPLKRAIAAEGEVTARLKVEDHVERFSLADENDLSSKEEIILDFGILNKTGNFGFVLNFRQTLMTTYFIYSAIGYMGDEVSDIFAKLELDAGAREKLKTGIKSKLGNIDIYKWNNKTSQWEYLNGFYETGPVAINKQLISLRLESSQEPVKFKMVLNKGLWRLDYVTLTELKEKVNPVTISPVNITNKGKIDQLALSEINDPDAYLVSMPGSEYNFQFILPEKNIRYELFLLSQGYYLEWMRSHWLKDKNLMKLRKMIEYPADYLREEAKAYKLYESDMEAQFWGSRIDTKSFSYHEN